MLPVNRISFKGKRDKKISTSIELGNGRTQRGIVNADASLKKLHLEKSLNGKKAPTLVAPGLRWIDANKGLLVFERRPCLKQVYYHECKKGNIRRAESKTATIPIPWQVYVVKFNPGSGNLLSVFFYWRNQQLRGFGSQVGHPWIPNIYGDGMVCLPNQTYTAKGTRSVAGIMDAAYQAVWDGGFNMDIMPIGEGYSIINRWIRDEIIPAKAVTGINLNPTNMLQSLFPTHGFSLEDVLKQPWPASAGYTLSRHRGETDGYGEVVVGGQWISLLDVIQYAEGRADIDRTYYVQNLYQQLMPQIIFQ